MSDLKDVIMGFADRLDYFLERGHTNWNLGGDDGLLAYANTHFIPLLEEEQAQKERQAPQEEIHRPSVGCTGIFLLLKCTDYKSDIEYERVTIEDLADLIDYAEGQELTDAQIRTIKDEDMPLFVLVHEDTSQECYELAIALIPHCAVVIR